MLHPFHLAIPVRDLGEARSFYGGILGFKEGRSSDLWVDLNMYGHQLVIHLDISNTNKNIHSNPVDGHNVPIPHFGMVLPWKQWQALSVRLKKHNISFDIEPYVRFKGEAGEQATMFFRDPSGNALEFKSFRDLDQLFAK